MSCENNANKVSGTAGSKSGITALQSKFGSVTGRMACVLTKKLGQMTTAGLYVTESFEGPKSLNSLLEAAVAVEAGALIMASRRKPAPLAEPEPESRKIKLPSASVTTPDGGTRIIDDDATLAAWAQAWYDKRHPQPGRDDKAPRRDRDKKEDGERSSLPRALNPDQFASQARKRLFMAVGLLKLIQMGSTFSGSGLARLSRLNKEGVVDGIEQRFYFLQTAKVPVTVWRSSLTPWLNMLDSGLGRVLRSDGVMFDVNGKTWHRGTVVLQTTQGERTITHLQSLTFPAVHYYYGRRLNDNEAVGIASAQKGFDPKHLPERPSGLPATGYAGQISEIESLLPMWASMKRGLIQAHLRWSMNPRGPQRQQAEITGIPAPSESPPQPDKKREDKRGRNGKAPRRNSPAPVEEPATEPKVHELHPLDNIGARVRLNNQEYKVMIRRVIKSPDGQPARADATYFDETAGVWKEVTDDEARQHLAAQVEAGLLETWQ